MHETAEDVRSLQDLLDMNYDRAGGHLRSILTPERRLSAEEVCAELQGMSLLVLATVNSRCEPIVGPVDGIFYRGIFWFGSAENSLRFRHIRARPQVSATHARGEELVVTVHGAAREIYTSTGRTKVSKSACARCTVPMGYLGFLGVGAVRLDRAAGHVCGKVQVTPVHV